MALLVYVDDIIITGASQSIITDLKSRLNAVFRLKDLRHYPLQLIEDAGLLGSKPASLPMDTNIKLMLFDGELLEDPTLYSRLIGRLFFAPFVMPTGPLAWTPESRQAFFLGDSLVSWKAKEQTTVSRSSAEAAYRALTASTSELVWLVHLWKDLHVPFQPPALLFCDNQAAIHIASNPSFHERRRLSLCS
ncbi:uncharacterized protein LOC111015415 [Momordica charantia]|uniref:Uncharacterized protein LOC111015415 n=1 Tax=Momordica charantia TaxID=3673 RepID=A0A6J1CX76_MOMCH|nr:uncharacterized protein LOC111015415 [Momordica charantia]